MKVTIEFDDREEYEELLQAIHAGDMHSVLFELEHNFWRNIEWYLNEELENMDKEDIIDYIRMKLSEELEPVSHLF